MQGILSSSLQFFRVRSFTNETLTLSFAATSSAVNNFILQPSIFVVHERLSPVALCFALLAAVSTQRKADYLFLRFTLAHRACTALRAASLRSLGVMEAARALPPLRPSCCAALFAMRLVPCT